MRRSVARVASSGGYSFRTDGNTAPRPEVTKTAIAEYEPTTKMMRYLCHVGRFRGSGCLQVNPVRRLKRRCFCEHAIGNGQIYLSDPGLELGSRRLSPLEEIEPCRAPAPPASLVVWWVIPWCQPAAHHLLGRTVPTSLVTQDFSSQINEPTKRRYRKPLQSLRA